MGEKGAIKNWWELLTNFLHEERKYLIILFIIFFLGFLIRMAHTADSPYLVNGIDGPYYVSQIDYLFETGEALHKDSPLAFYYLLFWRWLVGDTVKGLKIGMSVITGLMCVPTFFLMKRITGNRTAAIFSAFISVFNPYLYMITYNLYKNEIGILLLLTFFVLFFRFISTDGIKKKWKLLLLLMLVFVMIWGTHIMATGMAVLFTLSYLVIAIFRERVTAKRAIRMLVTVGVIGGCALLIFYALYPASFYKVYKIKFLTDLFEDESDAPKFRPNENENGNPFARFFVSNLDPVKWFGFPALIGILMILYRTWKGVTVPGEIFILSAYFSWLIFVQPSISRELVWRFTLVSFVPLSLVIGYGLATIRRKAPYLIALPIIILVLGLSFVEASAVARHSRTTISEEEYLELLEMRQFVPEECAIVGMGGNAYWYEVVLKKKIVKSHYVEEEDYSEGALLFIVSKKPIWPWSLKSPKQGPEPGPDPGASQPFPVPERLKKRLEMIFDGKYFAAYILPPKPKNPKPA